MARLLRLLPDPTCAHEPGSVESPKITFVSLAAVAERAQSLQRTAPSWRTEVQCSGRRRFTDACPDTRRFNKHCATTISTHSVSPDSMSLPKPNPVEPPWYVTRMPGGVGGVAPRGVPLSRSFSDFAKITAFDEGDKFIPFGMRQSNHVRIFADCDLLIGDHDFGALRAKRTQRKSDAFHIGSSLIRVPGHPTICSYYRGKPKNEPTCGDSDRRAFTPYSMQYRDDPLLRADRPVAEATPREGRQVSPIRPRRCGTA